jgi:hypothetical protein
MICLRKAWDFPDEAASRLDEIQPDLASSLHHRDEKGFWVKQLQRAHCPWFPLMIMLWQKGDVWLPVPRRDCPSITHIHGGGLNLQASTWALVTTRAKLDRNYARNWADEYRERRIVANRWQGAWCGLIRKWLRVQCGGANSLHRSAVSETKCHQAVATGKLVTTSPG